MEMNGQGPALTLEDRVTGFQKGLEQLQQRYGMRLNVRSQPEQLGEATLVKPVIQLEPIPNWQPVGEGYTNGAAHPLEAEIG